MKGTRILFQAAVVLILTDATVYARISHGYSEILTIDTVTVVHDDVDAAPHVSALAGIYPNPFNPRVTIEFVLSEAGAAELAIYDLGGRLVRTVSSGPHEAGRHQASWDGLDNTNRHMPTATYICRLRTAHGSQTRKLTLAR